MSIEKADQFFRTHWLQEEYAEWEEATKFPKGFLWTRKYMHARIQDLSDAIYMEIDKWEWVRENAKRINVKEAKMILREQFNPICYFHNQLDLLKKECWQGCFLRGGETCELRQEILDILERCVEEKIKWRKKVRRLANNYVNYLQMEIILGSANLDRWIKHGYHWYYK